MRKTTFKFETTDNNGKVREHVLNERYGLKRPQCTSEYRPRIKSNINNLGQ